MSSLHGDGSLQKKAGYIDIKAKLTDNCELTNLRSGIGLNCGTALRHTNEIKKIQMRIFVVRQTEHF